MPVPDGPEQQQPPPPATNANRSAGSPVSVPSVPSVPPLSVEVVHVEVVPVGQPLAGVSS